MGRKLTAAEKMEARRLWIEVGLSYAEVAERFNNEVTADQIQGFAHRQRWRETKKRWQSTGIPLLADFDEREMGRRLDCPLLTSKHERSLWLQLVKVYLGLPTRSDRLEKAVYALTASNKVTMHDAPVLMQWGITGVSFHDRPEFAQPLADLAWQVERGDIQIPEASLRQAPGALMVKLLRSLEAELSIRDDLTKLLREDPRQFVEALAEIRRVCETAARLTLQDEPWSLDRLTRDQASALMLDICEKYPEIGVELATALRN